MRLTTIEWKNGKIKLIDQTLLPSRLQYLYIDNSRDLWNAIKTLKVRGAPALGAAGALGVYIGVKNSKAKTYNQFNQELNKAIEYLGASRPTARNLFWALEGMRNTAFKNKNKSIPEIKEALLRQAFSIIEEDRISCRKIGNHGSKLVKSGDRILTICNAGVLATIDYGTALGVIYRAQEKGKRIKVFACETRPLLQGARLTTWELKKKGIDVTLICDNAAASLMRQGKINKVIVGADRIALNGDTANKIGTYGLAVLAKYHRIPFYVAAPCSTFDLSMKSGRDIPIEQRKAEEITRLFFRQAIVGKGIKVYNPAFDVTPNSLITALITDKGIIRKPYKKNIQKIKC